MSVTQTRCFGRNFVQGSLTDNNPLEVLMEGCPIPSTIWVEPATANVVTVTYKTSPDSTAQAWAGGPASAYAENRVNAGIYSVIFQRTTGADACLYGVSY